MGVGERKLEKNRTDPQRIFPLDCCCLNYIDGVLLWGHRIEVDDEGFIHA